MKKRRMVPVYLLLCLLGIAFGRYDVVSSAVHPLRIVPSEALYMNPHLGFPALRKLIELHYAGTATPVISSGRGEPGVLLYKDSDYLYVVANPSDTGIEAVFRRLIPWVFSSQVKRDAMIIEPRTARVLNRTLNKWEGRGIINMPGTELSQNIRNGVSFADLQKEFGRPLRIVEKTGGQLNAFYLDGHLRQVIFIFDSARRLTDICANPNG